MAERDLVHGVPAPVAVRVDMLARAGEQEGGGRCLVRLVADEESEGGGASASGPLAPRPLA